MRLLSFSFAAVLSLVSLMAPAAHAQTDPPPLDYARAIRQSEMVFVPYMGLTRGPIFYTQYEQVPTAATNASGMRRIIVNLTPTAHRQNLYNPFISQHGITDARLIPLPAAGSCQATPEIVTLLSGMPDGFKPRILGGNYPMICSLSLYFYAEDEQTVKDIIADRPVLTLRASVPLCAPTSPLVNLPAINQRLVTDGVLQANAGGDLTGNSWDVLFESAKLAQLSPSLFATSDPQVGWEAYIKSFTLDLTAQTAVLPYAKTGQSVYICTPTPLSLTFG